MKFTRKEMKRDAKQTLRGNWGWAVLLTLIDIAIVYALSGSGHSIDQSYINYDGTNVFMQLFSPTGSILIWIADFIALSMSISFLHLIDNRNLPENEKAYRAAFSVFTENRFGPECITFVLTSIFTFLWSLLLIIPGIIKSYSYSMSAYIVNDMVASGKQVGATDGIRASRELMDGHKMDLFIFDLSFLGWFILAGIIWYRLLMGRSILLIC